MAKTYNTPILMSLLLLNSVSESLFSALLPSIRQDLHLALHQSEWLISASACGIAIGMMAWGFIADHWGRRQAWHTGLLFALACILLISVSRHFPSILIARLGQGLGASINNIMALVLIRDSFTHAKDRSKAHARINQVLAFAPAGAWLICQFSPSAQTWRIYYRILACGYLLGLLALRLLQFPKSHRTQMHLGHLISILREPKTQRGTILTGLCMGIGFGFFSEMPHITHDLHHPMMYVHSLPFLGLSWMLGAQIAVFSRRHGFYLNACYSSLCALISSSAMLAFSLSPLPEHWKLLGLVSASLLTFVATGVMIPNAIALALEEHSHRAGTASSLVGFGYYFLGMLMQLAMTTLPNTAPKLPYLFVFSSLIMLLLSFTSPKVSDAHPS